MSEAKHEIEGSTAPKESSDDERLMSDVRPVEPPALAVRTGVRAGFVSFGRLRGNNNSDRRLKRAVRPLRRA